MLDLSREGVSRGHNICVISLTPVCYDFISRFDRNIEIIEIDLIGFVGKLVSIIKFRKVVKRFSPDVIHAHMVHSNIFVLCCKFFKVINVPVVITAHSVDEGITSFFYRLFSQFAAHCIHISSVGLSLYRQNGYFPSENSSYMPNGTAVYTESKEALNLGNPVRFVTVGRLAPEKNFEFMINAMEQLTLCGVPFTLSIIGDGVLRSDLERLIASKGLNERIRIEGIVNDVRARLESSDFFLMSSHFEGMPMSLLEACEVGLPSLVTDVGSCKEVIEGLPNCFAVTPNDLDQYVSSLRRLVLVDARNYFFGAQEIRRRVLDSYSVNSSFRELQKLYSNVACKSIT